MFGGGPHLVMGLERQASPCQDEFIRTMYTPVAVMQVISCVVLGRIARRTAFESTSNVDSRGVTLAFVSIYYVMDVEQRRAPTYLPR